MSKDNPLWGQERIAYELFVKLGIRVSPRTQQWTIQHFREALPWEHDCRYLIHGRDSIFSASLDESLKAFGPEILKTHGRVVGHVGAGRSRYS